MTGLEVVILEKIGEKVFNYILDAGQNHIEDRIREKFRPDPIRKAFQSALGKAYSRFAQEHPDDVANGFDGSFLEHEGAPTLAEFLIPDGHPDAAQLAATWANSLNMRPGEHRTTYVRDLEPAVTDFLGLLASALKFESDLRDLNRDRAFDQIAEDLRLIGLELGAGRATIGTRIDYLRWLIERNLYLDARGTLQTQRQVQLKLEDVYISLQAQREESPGLVDRRLLEAELTELEARLATAVLPAEEIEDQREQILARFESSSPPSDVVNSTEVLELAEAVNRSERVVILGDPGSGKSTLLRYLALKHAQATLHGLAEVDRELGSPHFPMLIRIADYAESSDWREQPLSEFLSDACKRHECPSSGLKDMLLTELERGNCLVLLDGLDEIVSADNRRYVVKQIEDFVRRYSINGNRFVVTSRVAGYRNAPLEASFVHYRVRDMDETQILRFLQHWCAAVEAAETPNLSPEARNATAQHEIEAIMKAVKGNPGVRRLASNPLLLRILALIHRTGSQLPQKRIELYRLAADTLASTWRIASGVPEAALELIKDEYLTPLLGKLSYWIHSHKATGIATEKEVFDVLCPEWARLNGIEWDPDEPNARIVEQVKAFLQAVREHTGLFVERAPRRYGFMHLTFEEYYAARHLVARSKTRATLIRQHLHDARWSEPILLALGFVGLESAIEAAELFDAAILAEGEDAQALGFEPSPDEDILGRDYLFALRCLGDNISAPPRRIKLLVERLVGELVNQNGLRQFSEYNQALAATLPHLANSRVANVLVPLLVSIVNGQIPNQREAAISALMTLGEATPEIVDALLNAAKGPRTNVHWTAVLALGRLGEATPEIASILLNAAKDPDLDMRWIAVSALGRLGEATPEIVDALLNATKDPDLEVRWIAVSALRRFGKATPEIVDALLNATKDPDLEVRRVAMSALGEFIDATPEALGVLLNAAKDPDTSVRRDALLALGRPGKATPEIASIMLNAAKDPDGSIRLLAVSALGILGEATPEALDALLNAAKDPDDGVRFRALLSLGDFDKGTPEVAYILLNAAKDPDEMTRRAAELSLIQLQIKEAIPDLASILLNATRDPDGSIRQAALLALGRYRGMTPEALDALLNAAKDPDGGVRQAAVSALSITGKATPEALDALLNAAKDPDGGVRQAAVSNLIGLADANPEIRAVLTEALEDNNLTVRALAILGLISLGERGRNLSGNLVEILSNPNLEGLRNQAAIILGETDQANEEIVDALRNGLRDTETYGLPKACIEALVRLAHEQPNWEPTILMKLRQALEDPQFDVMDPFKQSGRDHVFTALWRIRTGEVIGQTA